MARSSALFLIVALLAGGAEARERLRRTFGPENGLDARKVSLVVQDADGFVWVGTNTRILRYDGNEFVPFNRDPLTRHPESLVIDTLDGVLFTDLREAARLVDGERRDFDPPLDPPLAGDEELFGGFPGFLWIVDAHGIRFRDDGGLWSTFPHDIFGDRVRFVRPIGPREALIWSWRALWRFHADGTFEELYRTETGQITRAARRPSGSTVFAMVGADGAALLELDRGRPTTLIDGIEGIPHGLVPRDEAVWVSTVTDLFRWHPREGLQQFETGDPIAGQVHLLDDEGSLWIAGPQRLIQLPEPRTVAWTRSDGLPETRTRFLTVTDRGIYTSHYDGQGYILTDGESASAKTLFRGPAHRPGCLDGRWFWKFARPEGAPVGRAQLLRFENDEWRHWDLGPTRGDVGSCAEARNGGAWFAVGSTLFRTFGNGRKPEPWMPIPAVSRPNFSLLESSGGDLWVSGQTHTCRLPAAMVADRREDAWECHRPEGVHSISGLAETPSGRIWMRAFQGAFHWHDGRWRRITGFPRGLAGLQFSASPRGGLWIETNAEGLVRLQELEDGPEDYRVRIVERLGPAQGLLFDGGVVQERADGTLWIASPAGVQQVPRDVRDIERIPLRLRWVSGRAGDTGFPPGESDLRLRPAENDVELRFAALTYKHRAGLRYRFRVRGGDPWAEARVPEMRFVDLPPGRYAVRAEASLDGESWVATPGPVRFRVLPPWYRTVWAYALYVLAGMALLYGFHRGRLAVLLRLERQRTRIAMDLHDELGAGLGSIAVLSGVLGSDRIDEAARMDLAGQIERNADELSAALSDIVWSLRPRARSLGAVMNRLENRARQLAGDAAVVVDVPDGLDDVRVSLPVCKNVLSIGDEAIHNAARHGSPSRLELKLERDGGRFRMTVVDDGRGFDPDRIESEGLGLSSMSRRAADIEAVLRVISDPGVGTRVDLTFFPTARDRRVSRRGA